MCVCCSISAATYKGKVNGCSSTTVESRVLAPGSHDTALPDSSSSTSSSTTSSFSSSTSSSSDGHGAGDNAVLQHHAEHEEHQVEQEHGGAQGLVHLPIAAGDGDDDEEQHEEEEDDGTEEPVAAHLHGDEAVCDGVQEPGDRQTVTGATQRVRGHG